MITKYVTKYDAVYARQSIDKKESISIDSQIDIGKRECGDVSQVKIYVDRGYSGKDIERPDFQKLLHDIKAGLIRRVIVYRLDRISRSLLDFAKLITIFEKYNIEFVSCTEKFDTSTPIGKAMLYIIMVFAQLERETIQMRITDNYYDRAKLGVYMGGATPYGFDSEPIRLNGVKSRLLLPNENMQHFIEHFNRYVYEDISLNNISDMLNSLGVKTSKGKNWHSDKLSKLFRNPAYVKADADVYNYFKALGCKMDNDICDYIGENGAFAYGKTNKGTSKWGNIGDYNIVIAPHKGIIDSKTWLKGQHKLNQNKSFKRKGKSMYTWVSGLTKCMKCGYSMSINRGSRLQEDGTYTLYLRCFDRTNNGTCTVGSVRLEYVEGNVKEQLFKFIENINTTLKRNELQDTKRINDIKILISSKETEINNLLDGLASASGATMDYINKRINKLDSELKDLNLELSNELISNNDMDKNKIVEVKKLINHWEELELEDKKKIAKAFIKKIFVSKDKIEIVWNY